MKQSIPLQVVITQDEESDWLVVECPTFPGCISQGKTVDECLANIEEAICLWIETQIDKRKEEASKHAIVGNSAVKTPITRELSLDFAFAQ